MFVYRWYPVRTGTMLWGNGFLDVLALVLQQAFQAAAGRWGFPLHLRPEVSFLFCCFDTLFAFELLKRTSCFVCCRARDGASRFKDIFLEIRSVHVLLGDGCR